MRVAITGATGFIGRALARALMARSDIVVALSRHPETARTALPGAEAAPWPPEPGHFPAVDAVVHLAGEPVAGRWTPEKKRAIRDSRVQGTRDLVDALSALPEQPKTLISASAIGFYGDRGEEELTEASTPGRGFLPEVCIEWEAEAMRAANLGLRVAMLRTGIVLDREGGALAQMLPPFRAGLGGPMGDGSQWFAWIHRDDIVGIYLHLLDHPISGPVNGTAPNPVRQREFAAALGKVLGRPAVLPTPKFALRLLFGEFAGTLFESQRVLPKAAEDAGYTFRFPEVGEALRDALTPSSPVDASGG